MYFPKHLCARMVFGVSDNLDAAAEGSYLIALALGDEGAPLALQTPHLLVRVDADDEQVAQALRRLKVPDVPDVQQVEAAVGEDDARAPPAHDGHARDQT